MNVFEQIFNKITSNGWLYKDEAELLYKTALLTEGDIVEVGSYQGRSAMLLGSLGRTLHCIDPWDNTFHTDLKGDEIYAKFKENTKGLPIVDYRKKVEDCEPITAGFVYIDGDHTYQGTINQINFALACKPSYIAVHDVNDDGEGVEIKRACLELLGPWQERIERLAIWENK